MAQLIRALISSSRGPRFNPGQLHGGSQPFVTLVPGAQYPLLVSTDTWCPDTHASKIPIHIKKIKSKCKNCSK